MTALFYVAMMVMLGMPTNLCLRPPEDAPATLVVMAFLPLTRTTIFRVLNQQQELFKTRERQHILDCQTTSVKQCAEEFQSVENKVRIERYNLRHRLQAKDMQVQAYVQLAIPDKLPVPAAELSTVFANALENIFHAAQTLPVLYVSALLPRA